MTNLLFVFKFNLHKVNFILTSKLLLKYVKFIIIIIFNFDLVVECINVTCNF